MKNFKKIAALVLALALVCCAFAGCGESKETEKKDANTLVMGTAAGFPPYEFVDDNGKVVGIDAEIAEKVS